MITPNRLSVLRIVLAVAVIYLLLTGALWPRVLAFVLFVAAALTDYYDGYLARARKMVTPLGKILDPIADKLLILSTFLVLAMLGLFSIWWIVPMFIREIGVTALRFVLLAKGVVVAAERAGKLKVAAQLTSLAFCYAWLMCRDHLWQEPARLLALKPVVVYSSYLSIVIATALTLYSGYSFLAGNKDKF
jgi:CDP-diacylglycerol--glycerol-3-phosphate 3-phosphatidyltransferase